MITALIIILIILALIVFILSLKVHIIFSIDKEVKISLKILFFKFNLKKSSKKVERKAEKEAKKELKAPGGVPFKKLVEKYGISDTVKIILNTVQKMLEKVIELLKHATIEDLNAEISVCSEDPARTAIEYGLICSVFYPFAGIVSSKINIKNPSFNVFADYAGKSSSFRIKGDFNVRIYYIVRIFTGILVQLVKNMIKK